MPRVSARQLTGGRAAPFLKWAGGKSKLTAAILGYAPLRCATYFEPFLGGGAVFFAMASAQRFRRAIISDTNGELVNCYRVVRDEVDALLVALEAHRYDQEHYYRVRSWDPASLTPVECAARTIFLNKTGFNGLYRVNSKGLFNVPFGRLTKPNFRDEPLLRAASAVLAGIDVRRGDFEDIIADVRRGDFVYLDPPYVPISRTSRFTAYAPEAFGEAEQERLAATLRRLRAAGVAALLSNSDCPVTRKLYRGLPMESVQVARSINSVPSRRGTVGELLVRSFEKDAGRPKEKANGGQDRRASEAARDTR